MFLLACCGDPGDLHYRANNDPRYTLRGFVSPRQGTEYDLQNENVRFWFVFDPFSMILSKNRETSD